MLRMSLNLGARRAFPRLVPQAALPLYCHPTLALAMRGMADGPKVKDIAKDPSGVFNSAREELKNVGGDLAKSISGNVSRDTPDMSDVASITREVAGSSKAVHAGGLKDDFVSITKDIANTVPDPALRVGLLGGLPYVGSALAAVYYSRQAAQAIAGEALGVDADAAPQLLAQIQHIQVTYGAVLLGFLGAVHWGLEFAKYGGEQGYKRLALGVAPALYAWPTLALSPDVALAAQWAGFTALWYADSKATSAGWTPKWYSQYRFYLSILVGGCIIGTLAGANVLGPASDTSVDYTKLRRLDRISEGGSVGGVTTKGGRKEGTLDSDKTEGIEAVQGDEGADAYVIIKKVDQPEGKDEQNTGSETKANDPSKQQEQEEKNKSQWRGKASQVRKSDEKPLNSADKR